MMPHSVGRYRILRRLGAGGMGEVYLAEDPSLNRRVAIKLVIPAAVDDEASSARLVREAQAAATLDHPNVCAIYEVGEHEGRPYIAMQYVEGETLADRLARGRLPQSEAVRIAEQIADALAQAHARGIVHRDIKPQNVMLPTDREQVKVLDFGLAKPAADRTAGAITVAPLTAAGLAAGTTAYMSPEQHRAGDVAPPSDVFAFGCVLHEMVSGQHPFARASVADTVSAILHEDAPPLTDAPVDLQRIVRKCLEKDATRRYPTGHDLLVDLRNFSRDSSASGRRTAAPSLRKSRAAVGALVFTVIALLAAGAWTFFRSPPGADAIRVIAILPLHSSDPSSSYLGDGISESVINSLSQLNQIKVLARTTTFRYRSADLDVTALRETLGADAVMTGTVHQQGDALVVQAELTSTADGTQLWGHRYSDRRLADIFAMQEEIARDIASRLRLKLGTGAATLSKRSTGDVEAYRSYIIGREHAQKRTVAGLETALDYYQQAITRDPRYALAFAGLADAYLVLAARGTLPSSEGKRRALAAAEEALTLDADLAEAHAALGQTYVYLGPFDLVAGERALRRAIELNPGSSLPRQYLAVALLEQGRLAEAVRELEVALQIDPLSGFVIRLLACGYMLQADFTRALNTYRSSTSLGSLFATVWEAEVFIRAGAIEEGLRANVAAQARDDDEVVRFNHAVLSAALGKKDEALRAAADYERRGEAHPLYLRNAARLHMTLGDYDRGLEWLTKSIRQGAMPIFYKDEPLYAPVRKDPRFLALLREMHIPD